MVPAHTGGSSCGDPTSTVKNSRISLTWPYKKPTDLIHVWTNPLLYISLTEYPNSNGVTWAVKLVVKTCHRTGLFNLQYIFELTGQWPNSKYATGMLITGEGDDIRLLNDRRQDLRSYRYFLDWVSKSETCRRNLQNQSLGNLETYCCSSPRSKDGSSIL